MSVTPAPNGPRIAIRRTTTAGLTRAEIDVIRAMLEAAFAGDPADAFRESDWEHATGGTHFLVEFEGEIVGHASVVERELRVAGRPIRTGYVEAVATAPTHQRTGLGTRLMEVVNAMVREDFELGALGTGVHAFYERLGWRTWRGPSSVRTPDGEVPTPDEDGYIMVLATPSTPPLDDTAPISCEARVGEPW